MISYEIDKKSVEDINKSLQQFTKSMRNKILKKGLKNWGTLVSESLKSNITWNGESFRKSVYFKTKSYKRGRIIWLGVGLRSDGKYKGKLTHLYENGFRPRGKGDKIYATKFVSRAYASNAAKLLPTLQKAIEEAIKEQKGKV